MQPVSIDYGAAASEIAWVGKESAESNARRVLSRPGTMPVTLRFLEPIDPAALPDRKAIADISRSAIVAALSASAPAPDRL